MSTSPSWLNLGCGSALLLGAVIPPVIAQNEGASSVVLEEVVITAQRREESLQNAAVAVSAVTAEQLINAGINNPIELTNLVPALQILPTATVYPVFFVRGVGTFTANPYADAAVTYNYDGVPVARPSATSGAFYDLERIEVLKGPQGILYGRNATGGAINVLPVRPELGEFGGNVSLEAGSYDLLHANGAVNVPLGNIAAMRGAFNIIDRDGYYSDGTSDDEGRAGRLQVRVDPTEDLSLVLGGDVYRQSGRGGGSTVLDPTTGKPAVDTWIDANDPRSCAAFAAYYSNDLSICRQDSYIDNTNWGVNGTLNWKSALGTLTVVPAYRQAKLDTLNRNNPNIKQVEDNKQRSVEARFASDDSEAFTWLAGAFYMKETTDSDYGIGVRPGAGAPSTLLLFLGDNPPAHQLLDLNTETAAAFVNARYQIAERFRISAGARYTNDKKTFDATIVNPPWIGVPYSLSQSKSWKALTWRGGAEYEISTQSLLYLNVERGYKAGGFFVGNPVTGFSYDPEYVVAYTLGSKNTFLNQRLRLNIELFNYDYKDQQISHFATLPTVGTAFITENAGKSTIRGAEVETEYLATDTTLLGAVVQYNHTKYDKYIYSSGIAPVPSGCAAVTTSPVFTYDCGGQQMASAPTWTATVRAQQTVLLPKGASLVANLSGHAESAQWLAQDYLPFTRAESSASGDFSLGYHAEEERWSVTAFVNNFTDEEILGTVNGTGVGENLAMGQLGSAPVAIYRSPRTYGARIDMKF